MSAAGDGGPYEGAEFCCCPPLGKGDRVSLPGFIDKENGRPMTGIVIGERDWGKQYLVRLNGVLAELWFHDVELEFIPPAEPPEPGGASNYPEGSNIINLATARAAGAA